MAGVTGGETASQEMGMHTEQLRGRTQQVFELSTAAPDGASAPASPE